MKAAFLLPTISISGGIFVVLHHAQQLCKLGLPCDVVVRSLEPNAAKQTSSTSTVRIIALDELSSNETYDIAFATHYSTVALLNRIAARHYAYFVQSIETRFSEQAAHLAGASYLRSLHYVCIASWMQHYLSSFYGIANTHLCLNGVNKQVFSPKRADTLASLQNAPFRIMVEGPVDAKFKQVPESLRAASQFRHSFATATRPIEICLVTSSRFELASQLCRMIDAEISVFSRVSTVEMAVLYRRSHVLLKLSTMEGMFGPPLEAFHCGITAVVSPVTGHDEYIKHGDNALVADFDDFHEAQIALAKLYKQPELYLNLCREALATAKRWPSLQESTQNLRVCLERIIHQPSNAEAFLAECASRP